MPGVVILTIVVFFFCCVAIFNLFDENIKEFNKGVLSTIVVPIFLSIIFSAVWQWFDWIGGW
jgi:hypothetical protein